MQENELLRFELQGRGVEAENSSSPSDLADGAMAIAPPKSALSGQTGIPFERPVPGSRRILIVDDENDVAESLAVLLSLEGHFVEIAGDVDAAILAMTTFRPHLVLLDIDLPRVNGYDICRQIRGMQDQCETVVVALTGYGREPDIAAAVDAGFDRHLIKPAAYEDLERVIRLRR